MRCLYYVFAFIIMNIILNLNASVILYSCSSLLDLRISELLNLHRHVLVPLNDLFVFVSEPHVENLEHEEEGSHTHEQHVVQEGGSSLLEDPVSHELSNPRGDVQPQHPLEVSLT